MADTAERILDTAQALAQVRGYNGFSYADISAELAITKPSIHYHFPSKAELAEALIARYRQRFAAARLADNRAWSRTRPVSQPVTAATAKKMTKVRTSVAWPICRLNTVSTNTAASICTFPTRSRTRPSRRPIT